MGNSFSHYSFNSAFIILLIFLLCAVAACSGCAIVNSYCTWCSSQYVLISFPISVRKLMVFARTEPFVLLLTFPNSLSLNTTQITVTKPQSIYLRFCLCQVFFLPISYCFYTNVKSHLASPILIVTKTTAIQLICALILLPLHTQT